MPRRFGIRSKPSEDTPRRRWLSPRARRFLLLGAVGTVALGVAVVLALWFTVCLGNSCPSVDNLGTYDPDQAAKVFAADGRHITDLGLERRTVVPLSEMSPAVVAGARTATAGRNEPFSDADLEEVAQELGSPGRGR